MPRVKLNIIPYFLDGSTESVHSIVDKLLDQFADFAHLIDFLVLKKSADCLYSLLMSNCVLRADLREDVGYNLS